MSSDNQPTFLHKKIARSITDIPNELSSQLSHTPSPYLLTSELLHKLKHDWEAKNYNDLNNWCQKSKCRIEISQNELKNKGVFISTLQLINQNGLFNEKVQVKGEGHSKKEAKTSAMRNLMNELINRNLIHYGFIDITPLTQRPTHEVPFCRKDIKKIQNELIKQIASSTIKTYVNNLEALKELKESKSSLDWLEISYLWYYAIDDNNLDCIKLLLRLVYFTEGKSNEVSTQIKEEMMNSLIFASDYKFAIEMLNAYDNVVNYSSDRLICETYYKHMKKLYWIEILETLALAKEKLNREDSKAEAIDSYGTVACHGFRFSQPLICFIPELNITNISKNYKDKYITFEEIVFVENSKTKERSIGIVNSINGSCMQMKIRITNRADIASSQTLSTDTFRVIKLMNYFIYKRTLAALCRFSQTNTDLSFELKTIIFGEKELHCRAEMEKCISLANEEIRQLPPDFVVGSQQLNNSQREALTKALKQRLTLIQGPPGTGKTTTAIELIIEWLKIDSTTQILLCAESNCAVDILYNELLVAGISSYRYGWKEPSGKTVGFEYSFSKRSIESSNVICATCVGSFNEFIRDIPFEKVIIDEATQATELSSLIPLLHNCRQLVLIGDHKQLPPTVISYQAKSKGLDVSLFERLTKFGIQPQLLELQYRMHSSIAAFPSEYFYDAKLLNGVKDESLSPVKGIKWPNASHHLGFVDIKGKEELDPQSNSYYNQIEVNVILSLLMNIIPANTDLTIGIITPYDSQKKHLISSLKQTLPYSLDINSYLSVDTVDGFQGMEKDLIIVSLVRSNSKNSIGFLSDRRRINVTLTRARCGLVVIGNSSCMRTDDTWNEWLSYIEHNKLHITS